MIEARAFPLTADALKFLWQKFDENREKFPDELPRDPVEFTCWLAARDAMQIGVYEGEEMIGLFLFTGIVPNEACWAHVFIWTHPNDYKGLVLAAQVAAAAVFQSVNVHRINGLTPVTHVPARAFSEHVGFVVEGRLREAVFVGGMRTDAWVSGLLRSDLEGAIQPAK